MASYTIRRGRLEDCEVFFQLAMKLREATHDESFEGPTSSVEKLREDGFGTRPLFRFYLAIASIPVEGDSQQRSEKAVGFSSMSDMFCPLSGRTAYLSGLFVDAEHRGNRLGVALMKAIIKDCLARGNSRLSFAVDKQELNTRKFYASIGATNLSEFEPLPNEYWRFFQPGMKDFAMGGDLTSASGIPIAFQD